MDRPQCSKDSAVVCVCPSLCRNAHCLRAYVTVGDPKWCKGSDIEIGTGRFTWEDCPHCGQQITIARGRLMPHTLELLDDAELIADYRLDEGDQEL